MKMSDIDLDKFRKQRSKCNFIQKCVYEDFITVIKKLIKVHPQDWKKNMQTNLLEKSEKIIRIIPNSVSK